jgi:hypothetical protein
MYKRQPAMDSDDKKSRRITQNKNKADGYHSGLKTDQYGAHDPHSSFLECKPLLMKTKWRSADHCLTTCATSSSLSKTRRLRPKRRKMPFLASFSSNSIKINQYGPLFRRPRPHPGIHRLMYMFFLI